ncbi:MAG: hypothetical protein WCD18_04695 [Thermosynechococcaceae cyanobacterium]
MMPAGPLDPLDPWQTPPVDLDPELIETSRRLVDLSESAFVAETSANAVTEASERDRQMEELASKNQYLFQRNAALVAKVAELEAANGLLQTEVASLKAAQRSSRPWYIRWFGP